MMPHLISAVQVADSEVQKLGKAIQTPSISC
jgi:hypothetical protein